MPCGPLAGTSATGKPADDVSFSCDADEGIGHPILTGFGNYVQGHSHTKPAGTGSIEKMILPDCLNAGLMLM